MGPCGFCTAVLYEESTAVGCRRCLRLLLCSGDKNPAAVRIVPSHTAFQFRCLIVTQHVLSLPSLSGFTGHKLRCLFPLYVYAYVYVCVQTSTSARRKEASSATTATATRCASTPLGRTSVSATPDTTDWTPTRVKVLRPLNTPPPGPTTSTSTSFSSRWRF